MNLFETFVFKIYSCCKDEFPEVNAKTGTYRGVRQLSSGMFLFVWYVLICFVLSFVQMVYRLN